MTNFLRNKLFSQILLAASQVAFPLVIYPVVTGTLHADGLGHVNFADSIVQSVLILASLGIPLYGIREISIHRNTTERNRKFQELFLLQLAVLVPAIPVVWIIGLTSGISSGLLLTGSVALASSSLSCDWWFQGKENFFYIALRTFLIRTLTVIFIYHFVTGPADGSIYYSILTGSVVLTMLLNLWNIFRETGGFEKGLQPYSHAKSINWIYACYVLASLFTVSDSLLLGWLTNDHVVGYYSIAYRLIRMSSMILPTLGVIFIPAIAFHFAAKNEREVTAQTDISQSIVFFFGIPVSIAFFVLAPEIVQLLAGNEFYPSVSVIRILSPLPLLVSLSHLTGTQLLVSIKKEKIYVYFLAAALLMDVILNLMLIPTLHENGAAFSNVTSEVFVAVSTFYYLKKKNFLSLKMKQIFSYLLSALVIVPVVYLLRKTGAGSVFTLAGAALIMIFFYAGVHSRFLQSLWMKKSVVTQGND